MEVFGRHLGVVDTILSTTLSFLLKMNKIIMKIVALVCVTVLAGLIVLLTKDILEALILEIIVLYCCFKDINKD